MLFYKIEVTLKTTITDLKRDNRDEYDMFVSEIKESGERFFEKSERKCYFFISKIFKERLTLGGILKKAGNIEQTLTCYLEKAPISYESFNYEEITLKDLSSMLSVSARYDYIADNEDVLDMFNLANLGKRRSGFAYDEAIVDILPFHELISSDAMFLSSTLADEINRIYEIPAKETVIGHPVHYLIQSNGTEENMYISLMSALYSNHRILSKRYCHVICEEYNNIASENMESLYQSCEFGTVILDFNCCDSDDSQYLKSEYGLLSDICKIVLKYRNKVLTVFCFPRDSNTFKNKLNLYMGATTIMELYEDLLSVDTANIYLNKLAKEYGIRSDKKLLIPNDEKRLITSAELREKFDVWYDNKLRNNLFPQYKNFRNGHSEILAQKPVGSAYEELQNMIGLTNIKDEINRIINFFKAQKLLGGRNIDLSRPTMHMVFTGNPGTAKTTVARLFAQILKENEVLSIGKLYEVGRADIVGRYVGQTAPLIKETFKRAKGSVLFIDEAYSLVERDGLYGDEAINTIVQEMENHRDDIVVIFAGYPDEMNTFLGKNPGLRSRISKQIHFDDYSADELCQITKWIANQKGLSFTEEAINKLEYIFELARQNADFGNGRFARNIVEAAQLAQINRIICSASGNIGNSDLSLITAEDVTVPYEIEKRKPVTIGFTA